MQIKWPSPHMFVTKKLQMYKFTRFFWGSSFSKKSPNLSPEGQKMAAVAPHSRRTKSHKVRDQNPETTKSKTSCERSNERNKKRGERESISRFAFFECAKNKKKEQIVKALITNNTAADILASKIPFSAVVKALDGRIEMKRAVLKCLLADQECAEILLSKLPGCAIAKAVREGFDNKCMNVLAAMSKDARAETLQEIEYTQYKTREYERWAPLTPLSLGLKKTAKDDDWTEQEFKVLSSLT
jgi:hypothetical protein